MKFTTQNDNNWYKWHINPKRWNLQPNRTTGDTNDTIKCHGQPSETECAHGQPSETECAHGQPSETECAHLTCNPLTLSLSHLVY